MKKNRQNPPITKREAVPLVKEEKGGLILMCPFCKPSHVVAPGRPSACGAMINVTVVQEILDPKIAQKFEITCIKCGEKAKGGADGAMIRHFESYVHERDCAPDTRLLNEPPEYSRLAKWIYSFPEKIRVFIEKYTGVVQVVKDIDTQGKETGLIHGYFFLEKQKG